MSDTENAFRRAAFLLGSARFMTLATVSPAGEPWASTVNYVPMEDASIRVVWYSMRDARHSRNIESNARATASIFRTDLTHESPLGLDGLQLEGTCRAIPADELAAFHEHYYARNFVDDAARHEWMLPLDDFRGDGKRRFYELTVERLWLLDIDRWLIDKHDQRVAVPSLASVADALRRTGGQVK